MALRQVLRGAARAAGAGGGLALEWLESGVAFNPLRRSFQIDPYPVYRRLLERDPFHRSRVVRGWTLARYDDVVAALREPRLSADDRNQRDYGRMRRELIREGVIGADERDTPSMLRLDPPDHTRLRNLVSKAFTPRAVRSLRARVEKIVGELLDEAVPRGHMDVIRDLAYPLPVTVIAEMLGVPGEDRERFKHWSDEVVRSLGMSTLDDARRAIRAGRELRGYLEGVAAERRSEPREDLISALIAAEEAGDKLTAEEVFSTCELLLVAGNETTTNLIGNGLLALLRHPEQLELLRASPEWIDRAVEELLRFDSPVQMTGRVATQDLELCGRQIRRGQNVMLLLGAANRDPDQFPDPDRLDLTRVDNRHLSFSQGIHFCLGAPLARLEGQIALGSLLRRFPRLELATDRLDWGDNIVLRGLRSLPVRY